MVGAGLKERCKKITTEHSYRSRLCQEIVAFILAIISVPLIAASQLKESIYKTEST